MTCVASTTRRSKADIRAIKGGLHALAEAEQPLTIRHLFYLAVGAGIIEKTEGEYQRTVVRLVAEMRRDGQMPYSWIADNTRFMRKPRTYSNVESAIKRTAETYRRAMWDQQENYVEVWCEKDAISGVLIDVTNPNDVPLMICRGYPSITFIHSAAENIIDTGKPTKILYLGDADPSGRDIPRFVHRQLVEFAPKADIEFITLAVTEDQIDEWKLPTRPTKKTDTRARGFDGDSVDIDSIPPTKLRELLSYAIDSMLDVELWNKTLLIEQQEREQLDRMVKLFGKGGM